MCFTALAFYTVHILSYYKTEPAMQEYTLHIDRYSPGETLVIIFHVFECKFLSFWVCSLRECCMWPVYVEYGVMQVRNIMVTMVHTILTTHFDNVSLRSLRCGLPV